MIDCSSCPESQACCGLIIFEIKLVEKFKDKIEKGFVEFKQQGNFITYLYEDGRCPFLDRKTRLCKIYNDRPKVCRDYGNIENLQCPYFKRSGNPRSEASRKQIERKLDKQIKKILN